MKYPGLDILRGWAAFGIVGRHLGLLPTTDVGAACLYFTDTNVAIFGVVSGFLMAENLIEKGTSRWQFFCARCRRLLPAYFIWSAVFIGMTMLFDVLCDGGRIGDKFYTVRFWYGAVFFGNASNHLWYVAWLFYWGIALRLVWRVTRYWFVSLPLAVTCLCFAAFGEGDFFYYAMRLLAFMLFGIVLRDICCFLLRLPWQCWLGMFLAAVVTHLLCASWSTKFIFDAFVVIPLVLVCIRDGVRETGFGRWSGNMSFGVYLVHPLFAVGCAWIVKRYLTSPYGADIVIFDWLVVLLMSLAVVVSYRFFMRKLKFVRT